MSRIIKFEVHLNGQVYQCETKTEAEKKLNSSEKIDFFYSYIVRKEYSKFGNLLDEVFVG